MKASLVPLRRWIRQRFSGWVIFFNTNVYAWSFLRY